MWEELRQFYRLADRAMGGSLGILVLAVQNFNRARAAEAAAGIAFYAVFSFFPLMLVLVAAGSFVLETSEARSQAFALIRRVVPVSLPLVERNIEQVLEQRGTVGLVGGIGLLWSASGVFSALASQINRAWPETGARQFFIRRIVGLAMIGVLMAALFLLWVLSNAVLNLAPRLPVFGPDQSALFDSLWWRLVSDFVPFLFIFLLFFVMYRWVPNRTVGRSEALWGALVAALALGLATRLFRWYLRGGLASYNLVYGSLGAVVAAMFWVYLGSLIALFGAHLSSAIARRRQIEGQRSA